MSQTVITTAFEQWKAQQAVSGESITLDEFVFANVPDLDVDAAINRTEGLPDAAQIVHRQAVSRTGVVNENAVVYSVVLGADVGDFAFNWIGLVNAKSGTVAMIVHAPLQQKIKTAAGQQGNVLTRSFLMEFNGAQAETAINTPAETWQIDFTARMAGMDERQRMENKDIYGAAAFFDKGWLVVKNGVQYSVTKGAGYVAGLRVELAENQDITVTKKPVKIWLDVCWRGTLTSSWAVESKITVADSLADYAQNGTQHYVFAVASIDADGNVTDLRPTGDLGDQALAAHEKSRNHPDATTSEKGFVKLSSETNSMSESEAATPKAVKAVNDNANSRVPELRKVNGHALTNDVAVTSQDIFSLAYLLPSGVDLNTVTTAGLYYQHRDTDVANGANFPVVLSGALMVTKHAGLSQIYTVYKDGVVYSRSYFNGAWSMWRRLACADNETFTGTLTSRGEVISLNADSYRLVGPSYGSFWRNDGGRLYLMLTNDGDQYGSWNSFRPFMVELSTGAVSISGEVALGRPRVNDWSYIDARYYTKTQADGAYMPRTAAYTKAESDTRYNLKNTASMAASGWWQDASTGMIYQWVQGAVTAGSVNVAVTFPRAFPNACLFASVSTLNVNDNDNAEQNFQLTAKTNANCVVKPNLAYGDKGNVAALVWAVGY